MKKLLIGADILMAAIFAWRYMYLPEQIPLLYSRSWGEPQIVDYWYIALIPILMHVFYLLNSYIAQKYFTPTGLFRKLFRVANIFLIVSIIPPTVTL